MEHSLQDKLEIAIGNHLSKSQHFYKANMIVMHPRTWQELSKEVWAKLSGHNLQDITCSASISYRGIDVLRSQDVKEGEFKIA